LSDWSDKEAEGPSRPEDVNEGEIVGEEDEDFKRLVLRLQAALYQGAIPPPSWMEHYNRIVPGSAKQMMDDAHAQFEHRRDLEKRESEAAIRNATRGQWMGFTIGLIGVVGGLILAFTGVSLGGGVGVALTGLAALAAVYVTGNWRAAREAARAAAEERMPARQDEPDVRKGD
jgi:uncharacterized membrane protein